jgi:hypothetical protein
MTTLNSSGRWCSHHVFYKVVAAVELQWCRLREMEMGKERQWGTTIFKGEEARWLYGVGDGRHSKERHGGQWGRRWQMACGG